VSILNSALRGLLNVLMAWLVLLGRVSWTGSRISVRVSSATCTP